MKDQTIQCPHCKEDIPLTQSLLSPFFKEFQKINNINNKNDMIKQQEDLDHKNNLERKEISDQKADLEKKKREFNAEKSEFNLILEKKLTVREKEIEKNSYKRVQSEIELKYEKDNINKDQKIKMLIKKVEDLEEDKSKKGYMISQLEKNLKEGVIKASAESQQLKGEIQEINIEEYLRYNFPYDSVQPIEKGVSGADNLQSVYSEKSKRLHGKILWESKNTIRYDKNWVNKLDEDLRMSKADIAILATKTMPPDSKSELIEIKKDIYIIQINSVDSFFPLLRNQLIKSSEIIHLQNNKKNRAEILYEHFTDVNNEREYRKILEIDAQLNNDMLSEQNFMNKMWEKRNKLNMQQRKIILSQISNLESLTGKNYSSIDQMIENN